MSGFQRTVNTQQAPAVEGDFASSNPRASVLAGEGALVTGSLGVTVGNFAWALAGVVQNAFQVGGQIGFVHREMQALITAWLGQSTLVIPAGMPVTLHEAGDFWDKFAAGAAIGQKVYAYYADGTAYAAATGTPPTNALITANTATNTTLTVTANTGAPIAIGQPVSGAGIPAGAYISAFGTGTGGAGTYTLSAATTATASGVTVTATTAIETAFTVRSTAAAGEIAKISTWG
jgi:hypothetical protein